MSTLSSNDLLFDPGLLKSADFSKFASKFCPPVSPSKPGKSLCMRPLAATDFDRGYLQVLSQLTDVGEVTREQFLQRFARMKACPDTYYVVVIEDTSSGQIVGSSTLIVEQKFTHGTAVRAFLEDVIVSDAYRGKQLGKLIVATIIALSVHIGCYKITLDCKDELIPFYKSLGFATEVVNNCMAIRLNAF